MKSLAHYLTTLSGISLKIGIKEYYALQKKFGVFAAYELSADVQKIDASKEPEKEEEFYKKVIPFLFSNTKELQERMLRVVLAVRRNQCDEACKAEYHSLQEIIEAMPVSKYSPARWKSISAFCISNGLFYLGEICREKSRDSVLTRGYKLGDHWRRAIWYLEMNDLENAKKEIDKTSSSSFMKKYRKSDIGCAKIYYNILCEGKDPYEVSEYAPSDEREKAFHAYAKENNFIVIGPAPRQGEIAWDLEGLKVIRSNDRGEDHGSDPASSLSYYNGPGTKWICENGDERFSKKFDFVVVKHACKDLNTSNMHRVGDFNCILPAGHLNMLPVMVIDLKYNEADKIYVCGNNLFFSKNPWKKGYQSAQTNWNRTNFWPGLTNHEIYSQFHLLQNTYKHHAFIADEELDRVLSMSVREYADGMEKIYSIP